MLDYHGFTRSVYISCALRHDKNNKERTRGLDLILLGVYLNISHSKILKIWIACIVKTKQLYKMDSVSAYDPHVLRLLEEVKTSRQSKSTIIRFL